MLTNYATCDIMEEVYSKKITKGNVGAFSGSASSTICTSLPFPEKAIFITP